MNQNLRIPLYLDTNTLLDLLATLENGFSSITKTTTQNSDSSVLKNNLNGRFGVNLSFLQLGFDKTKKNYDSKDIKESFQEDRVHTYGSLMNKLINILDEKKILKEITTENELNQVNEEDYIVFKGNFIPNPALDSLLNIKNLMNFILPFSNEDFFVDDKFKKGNKKSKKHNNTKNYQNKEFQNVIRLIDILINNLNEKDSIKYVIDFENNNKFVCQLFNDYMRDKTGVELSSGKFKILGKVVKKLKKNESFNLLEGSNIDLINQLSNQKIISSSDLNFTNDPHFCTQINAPAIQIIPIAIYV